MVLTDGTILVGTYDNKQDFQGRNLILKAFKKLHAQYASDTYRSQTSIRGGTLLFLSVRNYFISILIEFFFLKIFIAACVIATNVKDGDRTQYDNFEIYNHNF